MKGSNKNRWLHAILLPAVLTLFMCVSGATRMIAQNATNEGQIAYSWKQAVEARDIMILQVKNLNNQMPGYTPGTSLHDNAMRRVAYFKAIVNEIDRGESVEQSLENALAAAATLGFTKEASYTPKIVLHALKEEARGLLTN